MVTAVECEFKPPSGQTKDYTFGCFSAKHAGLRSQSQGWLSLNQDNVSE